MKFPIQTFSPSHTFPFQQLALGARNKLAPFARLQACGGAKPLRSQPEHAVGWGKQGQARSYEPLFWCAYFVLNQPVSITDCD